MSSRMSERYASSAVCGTNGASMRQIASVARNIAAWVARRRAESRASTTNATTTMTEDEVRKRAYAMPLTSPAFPPGPYRFFNREYLIITYRTDREALERVVPEPLEVVEPIGMRVLIRKDEDKKITKVERNP